MDNSKHNPQRGIKVVLVTRINSQVTEADRLPKLTERIPVIACDPETQDREKY